MTLEQAKARLTDRVKALGAEQARIERATAAELARIKEQITAAQGVLDSLDDPAHAASLTAMLAALASAGVTVSFEDGR